MHTRSLPMAGALLALVLGLATPACARPVEPDAAAGPVDTADTADTRFHFGTVIQGGAVEHDFRLRNDGTAPLRIVGVQLTPPLQLARMPAVIPPGESGLLRLSLDTSRIEGEYQGQLLVMLAGTNEPRAFSVEGKVTPSIEILPHPAFFLSTARGTEKSAAVEIVNHESEPLGLTLDPASAMEYRPTLEVLEPGRRFRLTVTVPGTAPAGRRSGRIELKSSNPARPTLLVGLHTIVRERVHTFPDSVDFGQLRMRDLRDRDGASAYASQTLMVYQTGGDGFSVSAHTALEGVELKVEPGPQGDRVQITASLAAAKLAPGPLAGTLRLRTNDPEFPELEVPVTGVILAE